MDRLHDISAAGEPVEIGGKTYWMQPLKAEHFGEAEKFILSKQPKPLEIVIPRLAELPEPLQQRLLDAAYRDETQGRWLPKEQVISWLTDNAVGKVYCFWCWIKQSQPEITIEEAEKLRNELAEKEGEPAPDLGLPQGNLPGQAQEPVGMVNGVHSPGGEFTAT